MFEVHILNPLSNTHHHEMLQPIGLYKIFMNILGSPVNHLVDGLLLLVVELVVAQRREHHSISLHLFGDQVLAEDFKLSF